MIVITGHVTAVVLQTCLSDDDEHFYCDVKYFCTPHWLQWQSTKCTQFGKKENQLKCK